jgi:phosphoserine aminotransferase
MARSAPTVRPGNPRFSSGPCAKRPGWSATALDVGLLGRSHRTAEAKAQLAEVIALSKKLLAMPEDYRLAIVPASDTGAVELALWNLLGARGVDMLAWESFGKGWVRDVVGELRLDDVRVFEADYGCLPDLSAVDPARDVVFTWNGTTSGVRVPDANWISGDREGLTIADATSAVFAMALPWDKLDVVTWSWQKALGGEAAHGMLAMSPRALERLASYEPPWPLPKIFRIKKGGRADAALFDGATINTPSMLCVADALDALRWAEEAGGLAGLVARSARNFEIVADWVAASDWADFLAERPDTRSPTSICLKMIDPWFAGLSAAEGGQTLKALAGLLEREAVAFDIGAYRDAPPGLRLWGGPTVEPEDMAALLPWLDWAYEEVKARRPAA